MRKNCSVCNKEILTRYTMMDANNNVYCCQECFHNANFCHECGKICMRTSMFSYCNKECEEKHDNRDKKMEDKIRKK